MSRSELACVKLICVKLICIKCFVQVAHSDKAVNQVCFTMKRKPRSYPTTAVHESYNVQTDLKSTVSSGNSHSGT